MKSIYIRAIALFVLAFFMTSGLIAADYMAATSGDWNDPATWKGATGIPDDPTDNVIIAGSNIVTINSSIDVGMVEVRGNARLNVHASSTFTGLDLNPQASEMYIKGLPSIVTLKVYGDVNNKTSILNQGELLLTGTLHNEGIIQDGSGYICSPDRSTTPIITGDSATIYNTICGIDDDGPFPVEFITINASSQDNMINIEWTTGTEQNNDFFTVQRSTDGNDFSDIATVNGAGNSNENMEYYYSDTDYPLGKDLYYRIKQTDYNGSNSFSWVVDVKATSQNNLVLYPNPALDGDIITLKSVNKQNNISIYNSSGQLVKQISTDNYQYNLNSNELKPGLYILQIQNETGISSERLLIKNR